MCHHFIIEVHTETVCVMLVGDDVFKVIKTQEEAQNQAQFVGRGFERFSFLAALLAMW